MQFNKLKDFISKKGITKNQFCQESGLRDSRLSGILRGQIKPSMSEAIKIREATAGFVSGDYIMDEIIKNHDS